MLKLKNIEQFENVTLAVTAFLVTAMWLIFNVKLFIVTIYIEERETFLYFCPPYIKEKQIIVFYLLHINRLSVATIVVTDVVT